MQFPPGPSSCSIQGQMLRHSERREVAIFLRDGALWVADFIDGEGELIDAATWFRFNCGAISSPLAQRRMVLESAVPLSPELVASIRRLHVTAVTPPPGPMARLRATLTAYRARLRGSPLLRRFLGRERPP